jgi:Flp pilus assembly protein TadG
MKSNASILGRARDDHGGALVIFAVFLPVLILIATFVVDVGNWFEHTRHLQMQVDAGALAGGGLFTSCFTDSAAGNAAIQNEVRKYAGATDASYNRQIGGSNQGTVTIRINRKTYEVAGPGPDDTIEAEPCSAGMIDVKGTEANLPWFFGLVPGSVVPAINARARVRIYGVSSRGGNLPIAAPDNHVQTAEARFVDEDTGALLASTPLLAAGTSNGLDIFRSSAPASVPVGPANQNIGVRIVLSNNTSTTCGEFLVECYDTSRPNGGVLYLRGWSAAGTSPALPAPPLVRRVSLLPAPGFCTSSAFFSDRAPCSRLLVRAWVAASSNASIWANPPGCNNQTNCRVPLTNTGPGVWETQGNNYVPIPAGTDDRFDIRLSWEQTTPNPPCRNGGSNTCKGWLESQAPVQRTFGGVIDLSGPIKVAAVTDAAGAPVDSVERPASGTTTYGLNVSVGVIPNYENARTASDPVVALRVAKEIDAGGTSTSQNQSIDCDPNWSNLRDEITNGCRPQYTVNHGTPCVDHNVLWSTPQPWNCVKVETGGAAGQVTQGITERILRGGTCGDHPNNWSMFPNFPVGDTRVAPVMLTIFGAFGGQGQTTVPVTGFATFYITGWPRGGGNRKQQAYCPGDDGPVPKGYILGHFIDYVDTFGTSGGTDSCPFLDPSYSGLGSCFTVITD